MLDVQKALLERICKEYCLSRDNAQEKALELWWKCPVQLRNNLDEWAMGEPLTDIYIGKYSVPMIINQ